MVTVVVITYNQERWIKQSLDSILAQRTDYPFEIIVGEDWGTDRTRAICEDYANKYDNVKLAPTNHNLGVVANWANCIRHGSGKYIMNCAGDDYWQNPDKIQLQVEFMEAHPECVISHTDLDILNIKTNKLTKSINKKNGKQPPQGRIQKEILRGGAFISAVTTCYRRDAFEQYVPIEKFIELGSPREDWPTQLILSNYGEIRYLPISTSTYRVGQESISNTLNYDKIRLKFKRVL